MNRKKMLPLVLLAAGAVLLGVLLAVLTCENEAEEDTGIPLVDFAAEDVDELAYSGNNVDVTLLKGSEGNWMLDSDPTLPLEQSAVQSLVEKFTDLTAARQLQDSELGEIPRDERHPGHGIYPEGRKDDPHADGGSAQRCGRCVLRLR